MKCEWCNGTGSQRHGNHVDRCRCPDCRTGRTICSMSGCEEFAIGYCPDCGLPACERHMRAGRCAECALATAGGAA